MVEAKEVAQLVGVVGAPLHAVQETQLAVDQHLAAPRQVDEDTGDAAGEFGTLHRGVQGGPVDDGQGFGHLAGLVLGGWSGRCLGLDVDLLARAQPAHRRGEFATGDLQSVVAQAHQLDHEGASDADGDDERGGDGGETEEHGGARRTEQAARA